MLVVKSKQLPKEPVRETSKCVQDVERKIMKNGKPSCGVKHGELPSILSGSV